MAYETPRLDLSEAVKIDTAQKLITDQEYQGTFLVELPCDNDLQNSLIQVEVGIAERLGVNLDPDGFPYGVFNGNSVLDGLMAAYYKVCSTRSELVVARLELGQPDQVQGVYTMPLAAPNLRQKAAEIAMEYTTREKAATVNERARTELKKRTLTPSGKRIKNNQYYQKPEQVKAEPKGDMLGLGMTARARHRGTLGTR